MAFTLKLSESITQNTNTITQIQSYTCGTMIQLSEAVADSVTDQEHLLAIDISALKVFYMVSDQALTVETNSASAAQETFTLVANKPVTWRENDTAIFAGDVTKVFLTNASGSAATFQVMLGMDV